MRTPVIARLELPARPRRLRLCAPLRRAPLRRRRSRRSRRAIDCRVFAFRDEDTLAAMAEAVLAAMPPRFTLVGLSLGGYVAFEIVRRALARVERLALLDTTASPTRRRGAPAASPTSPPSRQAASRR